MAGDTIQDIARRYGTDVWGKGDMRAADELLAPDAVDHHPLPGQKPGREGQKEAIAVFHAALPDLSVTPDDIIVQNDKAVLRWTARGTHSGSYAGRTPTNHEVTLHGIDILRVEHGKIVERWGASNSLAQLGAVGVEPALS